MIRRSVCAMFLMVMLILPQTSGALPREVCTSSNTESAECVGFREKGTGYTSIQTIPEVKADGTVETTVSLVRGLHYQFKVTGTWGYDADPKHRADMAFSTVDGWSSARKTPGGRGLQMIYTTRNGEQVANQADTAVSYSITHTYSINHIAESDNVVKFRIFDQNYGDGNNGSLRVEVLRANYVTYTGTGRIPFGVDTYYLEQRTLVEGREIASPVPVNEEMKAVPLPGTPKVVTLEFFKDPTGTGNYCFALVHPSTGRVPSSGVCFPLLQWDTDYEILPYQPGSACVGTKGLQNDGTACPVRIDPIPVAPITVGPVAIPDDLWNQWVQPFLSWSDFSERPAKPGSGVEVQVQWQAEREHLYLAASGSGGPNENGVYQPFNFANPGEINWYLSNRDRLGAKINIALLFPDGSITNTPDGQPDPYYVLPSGLAIPGLGQWIEAAFSSRVAGR